MKLDETVIKRFDELMNKAHDVEATRQKPYDFERYSIDSEKFEEWATSAMNLLQRIFGQDSIYYANFHQHYENCNGWADEFEMCRGAFKAAKEDYEGGYLFKIESLISAELLDDILEQAEYLLESGYKDPACVVARVALENTLRKLCDIKGITHGKIDRMNADLCKASVYNIGMQKQITAWADRGNNAAHGKWDQYKVDDVKDMITGVKRFIADSL